MAVFGWLVILGLAIWSTLGAVTVCYGSVALTGKMHPMCLVYVIVAAVFVFCAHHFFPFVLLVKP